MVTSPYNRIVMERNTDVDELIDLPREVKPETFGAAFRNFDLAVALAPRSQDLRIVGATKAKVRVGYTYVRRWIARLTARLYVNRVMVSPADPDLCERYPDRIVPHEVDQLLQLVALGGAHDRIDRLRIDITPADREALDGLPVSPLLVHLGLRWFTTGSTLASTLELMQRLQALGLPLVVSCATECEEHAPAFENAGLSVVRGLPFHQWAALFERARCVVTVDTGATHVASAMRRPTVVAFEHRYFRLNSQEWAPYHVPSVLVRKPAGAGESSLAEFRDSIVNGVTDLIDA